MKQWIQRKSFCKVKGEDNTGNRKKVRNVSDFKVNVRGTGQDIKRGRYTTR